VSRLVLEDVPIPRPREQTTLTRPEGVLTFDWEIVPAVRRQIDMPDPRWLERLSQITAKTLVLAGGTIPVGHLIQRAAPEPFIEAVSAFLQENFRPVRQP
jgi:hypothetical protein